VVERAGETSKLTKPPQAIKTRAFLQTVNEPNACCISAIFRETAISRRIEDEELRSNSHDEHS